MIMNDYKQMARECVCDGIMERGTFNAAPMGEEDARKD